MDRLYTSGSTFFTQLVSSAMESNIVDWSIRGFHKISLNLGNSHYCLLLLMFSFLYCDVYFFLSFLTTMTSYNKKHVFTLSKLIYTYFQLLLWCAWLRFTIKKSMLSKIIVPLGSVGHTFARKFSQAVVWAISRLT